MPIQFCMLILILGSRVNYMRKYFIFIFWFATLLFPCSSFTEDGNKEWIDFEKNLNLNLEELSKTVFSCVNKTDTKHPIFHGCIDWHSSVHGHWALLRVSKYTKKKQYLDFVTNSLNPSLLEEERLYLRTNKSFEMPYGRAWFLRLAIEFESVTKSNILRPMADEIAQSLVEYYRTSTPSPGIGEYNNAEWAFRNLYDYAVFTKKQKIIEFINSQIKFFLVPEFKISFEYDREIYPEFFSRLGNYFHLLEVTIDTKTFLKTLSSLQPDYNSMVPVKSFENAHHLGMNYSRAWGLWSIYKKTNNIDYRNAYLRNVMMGLKEHEIYKDNYGSYGHWVPQFGIYAITYPFEEATPIKDK